MLISVAFDMLIESLNVMIQLYLKIFSGASKPLPQRVFDLIDYYSTAIGEIQITNKCFLFPSNTIDL